LKLIETANTNNDENTDTNNNKNNILNNIENVDKKLIINDD